MILLIKFNNERVEISWIAVFALGFIGLSIHLLSLFVVLIISYTFKESTCIEIYIQSKKNEERSGEKEKLLKSEKEESDIEGTKRDARNYLIKKRDNACESLVFYLVPLIYSLFVLAIIANQQVQEGDSKKTLKLMIMMIPFAFLIILPQGVMNEAIDWLKM